jgi:hypothetical protein
MITDLALTSLACLACAYVLVDALEGLGELTRIGQFAAALAGFFLFAGVIAALLAVVLPFTALVIR